MLSQKPENNVEFQRKVPGAEDMSDDIKLLSLKRIKQELKSILIDKYQLQSYQ